VGQRHVSGAPRFAAGECDTKYCGAKRRGTRPPSREPRFYRTYQIGPSMSLTMDNVNIIIYPVEYTKKAYPEQWKGKTELESTKGRVADHDEFSVANMPQAVEKLLNDGVK